MNKDMTYDQLFATSRDRMEEIVKEVFEKCKNDKVFDQALHNDPTETLKKEGLELQPGISFQIVKTEEDAKRLPHNIIPLCLDDKHFLDGSELDKVAGGTGPLVAKGVGVDTQGLKRVFDKWIYGELDRY